jgi:NADH-quinone oxidoreductase subunit J
MEAEAIVFWTAGVFSVVGALMTITRKNPVASVIWLVGTFIALAALFVGMGAFFVAAIQVLVYAGAIMVLFLFVVMLLNLDVEVGPLKLGGPLLKITAIVTGLALFVGLALVIGATDAYHSAHPQLASGESQVQDIAKLLFTKYLLPFEVTSALLLAAIVGAVVITRKGSES